MQIEGVFPGRGSAIVCAKNARTAATERAENFILLIWFPRWGSLDDDDSVQVYLYCNHIGNTSYWKDFVT